MNVGFGYSFPAIRGIQARREYFVSMCPMRMLPKIFLFNEEEITPQLRAQRKLNKGRVPNLASYISNNPDSYAFSAITVSLDGGIEFKPFQEEGDFRNIGMLHVAMDAKFIINDGQHRRAAIERAMKEMPDLADENIAVVFFQDPGLKRCQQLFADLNRHAVRPSSSIGILYDHRDNFATLIISLAGKGGVFESLVEFEKSSLSPRSHQLFTLSSLYNATRDLLNGIEDEYGDRAALASEFWLHVSKHIKEWKLVKSGKLSSGDVRKDFIHSHAIGLQAIAKAGNTILMQHPRVWKPKLKKLGDINWRKSNKRLWEGRAMIGGRVSKARQNVLLTTVAVKKTLGLQLSPEEQSAESAYMESR